jgi:GR25 family glycosyltransferase involved in LPS biosynthesis
MNYAGFYINLDRRSDRRREIETELEHHGLRDAYRRFSAVEGNGLQLSNPHLIDGEMGCFASHYKLLKENIDQDRVLHIIEDDVLFAGVAAKVISGVIDQDLFAGCDIVFTDVFIPTGNATYKAYKKFYDGAVKRDGTGRVTSHTFSVIDLKGLPFGATSSYLVNKKSIRKLHDLYEREISGEPRQPIDLFIRRMCEDGVLKVGCLFPFVTSIRLDQNIETDIIRSYHGMSCLAANIARYSFFIDADFGKCRDYLDKYLPLPPDSDEQAKILNHILAFSLTDGYRSF